MTERILRLIKDLFPLTALATIGMFTYMFVIPRLPKTQFSTSSVPSNQNSNRQSKTVWEPNSKSKPDSGNAKNPIANSTSNQPPQSDEIPAQDGPFLQNHQLTPGSYFPEATRQVICVPGYTKRVRNVPTSLKKEVYNSYGISHHQPGEYEVDHLVSLELGGDNEITNLWPEPYHGQWNAHDKDKLENEMHHRVCAGSVSLEVVQREIAADWVAAYRKYIGGEPK